MARPPRILYAAGPGDVIGTYHHWKQGRDDPSQVAVTYSSQFYDYCTETGCTAVVISSNKRVETVVDGPLRIMHRPVPFVRGPGPLYHLGQVWYGLRLVWTAIMLRADVAVVADGAHWFSLAPMAWLGVKVVPTLHCVLWPTHGHPPGRVLRMIRTLNRRFFRKRVAAVMSLSSDITRQVQSMLGDRPVPIVPFLPTYRPESFGQGLPPAADPPPFRVFFAGRIERNKGVFDLLAIARRFALEGHTDIEFDLCGDGSQLPALKSAVAEAGLTERFRLHGHTDKPFMRRQYEQCHAVIVPTTTDFVEGFNKVVAEGVLAGRPVITSNVCPALEYVREAVVEAPPDDAMAYGNAILSLARDPLLREQKRQGCDSARAQFYDVTKGWKSALAKAVAIALDSKPNSERTLPTG